LNKALKRGFNVSDKKGITKEEKELYDYKKGMWNYNDKKG